MKKKTRNQKTAPKPRKSFDKKLAALAPGEQMHQLFYGRPNNGGFFEQHLRQLATWRQIHEQREKPFWKKQIGVEQAAEFLQTELNTLAAFCRAALENWQPETFEQIAALMRKIKSEDKRAKHFNPFQPACGMEYKTFVRAVILAASKQGTLNQWRLACELENTNPNPAKQSDKEFSRTDSTRKMISEICKRLKIPSKIGCPKVE